MNRSDTSLERVDIVKLLIFVLIFVLVCMVMIFGFILPSIKDYRELNALNRSQTATHAKISQIYGDKAARFEAVKQEYKALFAAYETPFNKENFLKFASKFFKEIELKDSELQNPNEKFAKAQLNVLVEVDSPQNFYDFLTALEKYENIVKVDFPISMQSKEGKINMSFSLRIYAKG